MHVSLWLFFYVFWSVLVIFVFFYFDVWFLFLFWLFCCWFVLFLLLSLLVFFTSLDKLQYFSNTTSLSFRNTINLIQTNKRRFLIPPNSIIPSNILNLTNQIIGRTIIRCINLNNLIFAMIGKNTHQCCFTTTGWAC